MALDEFRRRVRDGENPSEVALRKYVATTVKEAEGRERVFRVTISTPAVDRDGDTIAVGGWELDDFRKNPVVLWAHQYSIPPVGRDLEVFTVGDQALIGTPEFMPPEVSDFADTVYRMLAGGWLNAFSVGFNPSEWKQSDRAGFGLDFTRQGLLEYSVVPIPSNPEALMAASASGVDVMPLAKWCEEMLDTQGGGGGLWLPRSVIEHSYKVAGRKGAVVRIPKALEDSGRRIADLLDADLEVVEMPKKDGEGNVLATCGDCGKDIADPTGDDDDTIVLLCTDCEQSKEGVEGDSAANADPEETDDSEPKAGEPDEPKADEPADVVFAAREDDGKTVIGMTIKLNVDSADAELALEALAGRAEEIREAVESAMQKFYGEIPTKMPGTVEALIAALEAKGYKISPPDGTLTSEQIVSEFIRGLEADGDVGDAEGAEGALMKFLDGESDDDLAGAIADAIGAAVGPAVGSALTATTGSL